MTDIATLRRQIKVLSFDQYGTVVDMQGGLVAFATPLLKAKGRAGRAEQRGPYALSRDRPARGELHHDRRGRPYGQTPHQAAITVSSMSALADMLLA